MILENANWVTDLNLGKKLYEKNCVQCHRDRGQGNWKEDPPIIEGQPAPADSMHEPNNVTTPADSDVPPGFK